MRVLLVEDSARLRKSVVAAFRRSGYAVDVAADGAAGLALALDNAYDAIVLDIMLPLRDGLSIVAELRRQQITTHILLLTARDAIDDRVRGLGAGADDYLVKPFALEELLARVQALCRRSHGVKQSRMTIGDLDIDLAAREVWRRGQSIRLKPREYALLELLALHRGEVVSRRQIELHLYAEASDPASNVVEAAISVLRKGLAIPGAGPLIHTRHGLGYVLKAAEP